MNKKSNYKQLIRNLRERKDDRVEKIIYIGNNPHLKKKGNSTKN
ncbi:hypothetical protein KL86DYS1_10028 [uncultured Dysgonomonas sp.]|uniref:Uncharacterized protein n=1 Tax=uncultured Dysgonomonas sp. TaxID=206096 RepID=A0A212IT36_9BACT|nr:hypothetical protein KL86DYS1_10028 [uncultured Dysgonomonas sp.]